MLKTLHYTAHNSEEATIQAFTAGLDVRLPVLTAIPLLADLIKRKVSWIEEILNESDMVCTVKFKNGAFEDHLW